MTRHRPLIILTLIILAGATGALGFRLWHVKTAARREHEALTRAQACLKADKPAEALALAEAFLGESKDPAWAGIQLRALTRLQDLPKLALIYDHWPERVLADEDASVLLARGFLQAHRPAECNRMRTAWRGREQHLDAWLLLETDQFLLDGKPRQAEKLLRSRQLPGEMDASRLARLALLTGEHDLAESCRLLDQAVALQPTNSVARWFRGEILERMGRMRLARVEYASALAAAPHNWYWRDQLAEFYLRCHNQDLALDTWAETNSTPSPDFIQLKVQFFHRVLRPAPSGSPIEPTRGDLEPLVGQIAALKPGKFFDPAAFKEVRGASLYAAQRPEVFWLRLLDALQSGNETAALGLLTTEPPRLQAWDPDLAGALARILYFRRKQSLNPPGIAFKTAWGETNRPAFFTQLERAAREEQASPHHRAVLAPELSSLLGGSNAFSAALLAAGWREAALQLRRSTQVAPGEPDWLSAACAEALSLNRNPPAALEFLGAGKLPPASALVRAELLIESGRRDEARTFLCALARLDSPAGFRAAFLLALEAAEKKEYGLARQCVAEQPLLAQSDLGKEMLARLALAENRPAEAQELYNGIVKTSIEAKTWFARQAFAERRWKDAREMIKESLELMPDSPQLRESLVAIGKAEAGSPPPAL